MLFYIMKKRSSFLGLKIKPYDIYSFFILFFPFNLYDLSFEKFLATFLNLGRERGTLFCAVRSLIVTDDNGGPQSRSERSDNYRELRG